VLLFLQFLQILKFGFFTLILWNFPPLMKIESIKIIIPIIIKGIPIIRPITVKDNKIPMIIRIIATNARIKEETPKMKFIKSNNGFILFCYNSVFLSL